MAIWSNYRILLCTGILIGYCTGQLTFLNETVCKGTSQGLVARGDTKFRYNKLQDQYTNCTYIEGNLEIVFLEDISIQYNFEFLKDIKEVTGYILIVSVYADYVNLDSLRIIRGKTLWENKYSLYVALNSHVGTERGLRELRFKSLFEILRGKVYFQNNNKLCFEETINWSDINPREKPPVEFNSTGIRRKCPECDDACIQPTTLQKTCWGEGPNMCQRLSQGDVCHGSCDGRCYGKLPNQCCHPQCAALCNGPKKTDCLGCRNFNDNGACVAYCPPIEIYDVNLYKKVPNPDAKFTYGSLCVKECPQGMLKEDGACVVECRKGKTDDKNGNCVRCSGACPRVCKGTPDNTWLTAENIHDFAACTKIQGTLRIFTASFQGDPHLKIPPIHPSNLSVFEDVEEISGNLIIQSNHTGFRNLSYFKSLKYISGREPNGALALNIMMTHLESLELVKLKKIRQGGILIAGNSNLCYVSSMNWRLLILNDDQRINIQSNAKPKDCVRDGHICDDECSLDGCWGKGKDKCLQCRNYRVEEENMCVKSCSHINLHYHAGNKICKPCHAQCKNNCTGPEPNQCDSCKNVTILDNNNVAICLAECPSIMYPDENNICRKCHKNCADGCTGNSDIVGPGGCNSCEVGFRKTRFMETIRCLPTDTNSCPDSHHLTPVKIDDNNLLGGKRMCEPCHRLCQTCNGASNMHCIKCKFFEDDNSCVEFCPTMTFGNKVTQKCEPCFDECRSGCLGSESTDCLACKNFKIYIGEDDTRFNCTDECPQHLPYSVLDNNANSETASRTVCADNTHPEVIALLSRNAEDEKKKMAIIVAPSVAGVLIVAVLIACIAWCCQKRAKAKEKTAKLTAKMTGWDEEVPLTPTTAKPDLAQLKLIKEYDLRRGGIIGSGAFGTVYKGFWIPEGENVKIPVAIKVLQEGTSPNQNKELLEEARVMSSVEHQYCVRILAVCMTAQMMLITQLMPLGCLLDYVRKNKDHIGSKVLLNWCTQIAKGMVYLEERGIVHRDLAARNVLLHTSTQVKITDFGLAKLLDYDEEVYQAAGGKMPIKWLALECIQHRIFTHKSDVWSYGVTVWELMTYGQKPYDSIRARDVPDLLEKGERLPQPHCCTIDVYMIMIKCWMLDAESRPSFLELQEEFSKMARDPGRYLVIQGDVLKRLSGVSNGAEADNNAQNSADTSLQGDKLMRLPSETYDKHDLMRSMSVAIDGPEEVVEADDYLQPHLNSDESHDNNNAQVKVPLLEGASQIDGKFPGASKPRREKRYAHLDNAVQARQQRQTSPTRGRGDSINSRYSSDPVKFLKDKDDVELGLPMLLLNGGDERNGGLPYKRDVPLHLPVDEDDYLQPKSQIPPAYMDLNDKGYYQNERDVFDEEEEYEATEEEAVNKPLTQAIDNPEYFDTPKQNGVNKSGIPAPLPKPRNLNYYNDINQLSPLEKKQLILRVNSNEGGVETSI